MINRENKVKYVMVELAHHLPFSIFGVSMGIFLIGILSFLTKIANSQNVFSTATADLFHIFHSSHILFSAITTTAMFFQHEKRVLKAIVVGFIGTVPICTFSDIIFPYFGGVLTGNPMAMHICIIEEPGLILPFALVGILAGLLVVQNKEFATEFSHSVHVFISSAASILYLVSNGMVDWIHQLGAVLIITIVAVMVPCCTSDIIFPLTCVHRNCDHS